MAIKTAKKIINAKTINRTNKGKSLPWRDLKMMIYPRNGTLMN